MTLTQYLLKRIEELEKEVVSLKKQNKQITELLMLSNSKAVANFCKKAGGAVGEFVKDLKNTED